MKDCESKEEIQIEFHHIRSITKSPGEWKEILGERFSEDNIKRIFELDENVLKRLGEEILESDTGENRFRAVLRDDGQFRAVLTSPNLFKSSDKNFKSSKWSDWG